MKIYVVRERVDWHNTDPTDETHLFIKEKKALAKAKRVYEKYLRHFDKKEIDLVGNLVNPICYQVFSEADDYVHIWVEEKTVVE